MTAERREGALCRRDHDEWQQEFEAPNPKQSIARPTLAHPNLVLLGSKLMLLAVATGAANDAVLLRLDADTGALFPANP